MKNIICGIFCLFGSIAGAANWSTLFTDTDVYLSGNGLGHGTLRSLAVSDSGLIAAVYDNGFTSPVDNIFFYNSDTQTSTAVTQFQMITAIEAVNGSSPAPTSSYIAGMDFTQSEALAVHLYNSNGDGALLKITPPSNTIAVLSCARNGNPSPIQGQMALNCDANNAFFYAEGQLSPGYGQDALLKFDTSSGIADGSMTPTLVIGEAALTTAAGAASALDVNLSGGAHAGAQSLLVMNSNNQGGLFSTNDNILQVNVATPPAAATYVTGADIKSDTGLNTSTRWYGIAAKPEGAFDLTCTDGVVHVSQVSQPTASATLETRTSIRNQLGIASGVPIITTRNAIAYDPFHNRVLMTFRMTTNVGGARVITYTVTPGSASAADWQLFN